MNTQVYTYTNAGLRVKPSWLRTKLHTAGPCGHSMVGEV